MWKISLVFWGMRRQYYLLSKFTDLYHWGHATSALLKWFLHITILFFFAKFEELNFGSGLFNLTIQCWWKVPWRSMVQIMKKLSWASNFDKVGQKVGFSNAKVINNDYITTVVYKILCMKNWCILCFRHKKYGCIKQGCRKRGAGGL